MAFLSTRVEDKSFKDFRQAVFKVKGLKKGDLKAALEEAMELYVQKHAPELMQVVSRQS